MTKIEIIKQYGLQVAALITGESARSLRYTAEKLNIQIPHATVIAANTAALLQREIDRNEKA